MWPDSPLQTDDIAVVARVAARTFLLVDGIELEGCACGVASHGCEFDSRAYRDDLYERLKVDFPFPVKAASMTRRAEYLAGRHCAAGALLRADASHVQVGTGFAREPRWPQGMVGSITHTRDYALAVVAPEGKVRWLGVDAEDIAASVDRQTVAMVARDSEYRLLRDAFDDEALAFSVAFSLKESFYKAAYRSVRRYFDFLDAEVVAADPRSGELELRVRVSLSADFPAGRTIRGSLLIQPPGRIVTLIAEAR